MEMRIVAPDTASATILADRLGATLGPERVSLRSERREVDVAIVGEPDADVVWILNTAARWFDQAHVGFLEMWLGERSYTFAAWVPADAWR